MYGRKKPTGTVQATFVSDDFNDIERNKIYTSEFAAPDDNQYYVQRGDGDQVGTLKLKLKCVRWAMMKESLEAALADLNKCVEDGSDLRRTCESLLLWLRGPGLSMYPPWKVQDWFGGNLLDRIDLNVPYRLTLEDWGAKVSGEEFVPNVREMLMELQRLLDALEKDCLTFECTVHETMANGDPEVSLKGKVVYTGLQEKFTAFQEAQKVSPLGIPSKQKWFDNMTEGSSTMSLEQFAMCGHGKVQKATNLMEEEFVAASALKSISLGGNWDFFLFEQMVNLVDRQCLGDDNWEVYFRECKSPFPGQDCWGFSESSVSVEFTASQSNTGDSKVTNPWTGPFHTLMKKTQKMSNNFLMSCSIMPKEGVDVDSEAPHTRSDGKEDGLLVMHEYAVTEFEDLEVGGSRIQLVQLQNPHGEGEWNGDWGDKSAKWTPELKAKMEEKYGKGDDNDGKFWMSWQDFTHAEDGFSRLDISQNFLGAAASQWYHSQMQGMTDGEICQPFHGTWVHNARYCLNLPSGWMSEKETSVVVGMSAPNIKGVLACADDAVVKIGFKVIVGIELADFGEEHAPPSSVPTVVPAHRQHEDASYLQNHCPLPIWHSMAGFVLAYQKPKADREVSINFSMKSKWNIGGKDHECKYYIVPIIEELDDEENPSAPSKAATAPYFIDVWANDKFDLSKVEDGWFRDFHVDQSFTVTEDVVYNWLCAEGWMEGEPKAGAPKTRKKLEKKTRKKLEKKTRKKLEKKTRTKGKTTKR